MDTETKSTLAEKIGIKPASNQFHSITRVAAAIVLLMLIAWMIYIDVHEGESSCEIPDFIEKDSIMYKTISELEGSARKKYIKMISGIYQENSKSQKMREYLQNVGMAIIAGVASEYMVNGNLAKPMGILSKTATYSMISNLISM